MTHATAKREAPSHEALRIGCRMELAGRYQPQWCCYASIVLEQIREALERLLPHLGEQTQQPWSDGLFAVRDLRESGEIAQLMRPLRSWEGAAEFDGVIRHFGHSAHSLSLDELAEWLLLRAADVGIDETLRELEKYRQSDSFEAVFTLWLSGLQVSKPLQLSEGIRLVPFKAEYFADLAHFDREAVAYEMTQDGMGFITSALSLRAHHPKILRRCTPDPAPIAKESTLLATTIDERLNFARLICGVIEPRDVMRSGQRAQILASVPCHLRASYASHQVTGHSLASGFAYEDFAQKVRHLQNALSKFTDDRRRQLSIPLERLQNAIHERHRVVDSAIDLGIALESLLLEDTDASELGYRMSTRAARLLGTTPSERKDLRQLFRALYSLRSRAVHRGKADLKSKDLAGRANVEALLQDGIDATARAARAVIETGLLDWTEFDLK